MTSNRRDWLTRILYFTIFFLGIEIGNGAFGYSIPNLRLPDEGTWEASLPFAPEIKDQGRYPYCGLFAMTSFLELWANTQRRAGESIPPLDPGFLGMAYNLEVSDGTGGTSMPWLVFAAFEHGILPKGAQATSELDLRWPLTNWQDLHRHLLPKGQLEPLVEGKYRHASQTGSFTGPEFLKGVVGIDFHEFEILHSDYEEPFPDVSVGRSHTEYRYGSRQATAKKLDEEISDEGLQGKWVYQSPTQIFPRMVSQLYDRRPVLVGMSVGIVDGMFRNFQVVSKDDLSEVGKGRPGSHAVVVVGHCDQVETTDPLCRRFAQEMDEKQVSECLVIQNSWGEHSNAHGYACLSQPAWARMLHSAVVLKRLAH